ncbi:MAG: YdcF family protein [Caulobacterales bacterium]
MSWLKGAFLGAITVAILAFVLGFLAFSHGVREAHAPDPAPDVDGIVALTGGSTDRLSTGLHLLEQGRGRRLLISGVNPDVKDNELFAVLHAPDDLAQCCVDLGRAAEDTLGNASETAVWARRNGFRKLILVTDDYHMPRSYAELRLALPEAEIIPYPIETRWAQDAWRSDLKAASLIGGEYLKYLMIRTRELLIDASEDVEKKSA